MFKSIVFLKNRVFLKDSTVKDSTVARLDYLLFQNFARITIVLPSCLNADLNKKRKKFVTRAVEIKELQL